MKLHACVLLMTLGLLLGWAGPARADVLLLDDFESGDLSAWSVFTTPSGWLGSGFPDVVSFDTTGDGDLSLAAAFSVGQTVWLTGNQGGGIFRSISLISGDLTITADVAGANSIPYNNIAGGLIEVLLDGVVVDSSDLGWISPSSVERGMLSASLPSVSEGTHELRFRITRPFLTYTNPVQYIDNVQLSGSAVGPPSGSEIPEPASVWLLVVGVAGATLLRRKA